MLSIIIPVRNLNEGLARMPHRDHSGVEGVEVILQGGDGGIPLAFNRGASHAHGKILLFTNDDVNIDGDITCLIDPPVGENWWLPTTYLDATGDANTIRSIMGLNFALSFALPIGGVGTFMAMRRELFQASGGFQSEDIFDDVMLSQRLRDLGAKPSIVPLTVTIHRRFATHEEIIDRRVNRRPPSDEGPYIRLPPPSALRRAESRERISSACREPAGPPR